MPTYMVPINPAEAGESQTVDIVQLNGTKKQRKRDWAKYLRVRCGVGVADVHERQRITKALGFKDLL